jgi:hypothetical protein
VPSPAPSPAPAAPAKTVAPAPSIDDFFAATPVMSPTPAPAAVPARASPSQPTGVARVRVAHAYAPTNVDELALKPGEIITVLAKEEDGWWHGTNASGASGLFPSNFVKEI